MNFGPTEIILILLVIALLFGAKKLPELGRGLGQGIKEFKNETGLNAQPGPDARPLSEQRVPMPGVTDVQATP
ncbi:twin-arginine translocase TatA/TatE family subunit [Deinococcus lacus]|uniref:Sec-independent protein translocase protein TatA n=1 Tax=Deinococcus lacus TaxID=392561 RepID=A0ABW1YAI6_9DEIO